MALPKEKIIEPRLIGGLSVLAKIVGIEAANAQADINPNLYPVYRGAPVAEQPWEWHATPGPIRRGSRSSVCFDPRRGSAYIKDCPAPQASPPQQSRTPRAHRHPPTPATRSLLTPHS